MAITTVLETPYQNGHSEQYHQHSHHNGHNNYHHHNHHQHNGHNGYSPIPQHYPVHSTETQLHQQYASHSNIIDVWKNNFHQGMQMLRHLAKQCSIVAIDTEFPGIVAKIQGEYSTTFEQAYHNIKANIDILKPIQIGFSFYKDNGTHPQLVSTIQFNFMWDIDYEAYAENSIQLLQMSGIDFNKLRSDGIGLQDFGEAFLTSGLALNENLTWIGFHSAYDWAYLLKICTNWDSMPKHVADYQKMLLLYFPRIVDIKSLMGENRLLKGGLQDLADNLKVKRIGAQHQAGSDSKLTGDTYFKFIDEYCEAKLNGKHINLIYGLNYCPQGAHYMWAPLDPSSCSLSDDSISASGASASGSSSSINSGRTSPSEDDASSSSDS